MEIAISSHWAAYIFETLLFETIPSSKFIKIQALWRKINVQKVVGLPGTLLWNAHFLNCKGHKNSSKTTSSTKELQLKCKFINTFIMLIFQLSRIPGKCNYSYEHTFPEYKFSKNEGITYCDSRCLKIPISSKFLGSIRLPIWWRRMNWI